MASLQTRLSAILAAADKSIQVRTAAGTIQGELTDDGTVGDSIVVMPQGGRKALTIPKAAIVAID